MKKNNKKKLLVYLFAISTVVIVFFIFFVSKSDFKVINFTGKDKTEDTNDNSSESIGANDNDNEVELDPDSNEATDYFDDELNLGYDETPAFKLGSGRKEVPFEFNGVTFNPPIELPDFLDDSGLFYLSKVMGDRHIPFFSESKSVFGYVNKERNDKRVIVDTGVERYDIEPNNMEFVFLKGYGNNNELFYDEVGSLSNKISMKEFGNNITISNAVIYDKLYFYNYSEDDGETYKTDIIPLPYQDGDPDKYLKLIQGKNITSFGTDGDRLIVYDQNNGDILDLTNGNSSKVGQLNDLYSIGEIIVEGDKFVIPYVQDSTNKYKMYSSLIKGTAKTPGDFYVEGFVTDNIVIGTVDGGALAAYDLMSGDINIISHSVTTSTIDRAESAIYFSHYSTAHKMTFE